MTELGCPLVIFKYRRPPLFHIMTGEPAHPTLEERMVPDLLFSSECSSQLYINY